MANVKNKDKKKELPKPGGDAPKADKAMLEKIIAVCNAFLHVKIIYVNQAGEYHFHAIPGFSPVDADALRNMNADDFEETEVVTDPPAAPAAPVVPATPAATTATDATATEGGKAPEEIQF